MNDDAKTISRIINWILDYVQENGKTAVVFGFSGGLASHLMFHILKDITKINVFPICFNAETPRPNGVFIMEAQDKIIQNPIGHEGQQVMRYGSFHSALAALAQDKNGVVLGTTCKSRIELVRHYYKHGDGSADIYPFAGLYYSDIYRMLDTIYKTLPVVAVHRYERHEDVLDVKWADIEWASKLTNNIITAPDVTKHKDWFVYTARQKKIIARINFLEKNTRHKIIHRPKLEL